TAGAGASLSRAGPRSVFGADAMVVAVCRVRRVTRSMVDDPREPADFFLRFCECLNKAGAPPWAPITLTLSLQPSAIQLAISHQPSALSHSTIAGSYALPLRPLQPRLGLHARGRPGARHRRAGRRPRTRRHASGPARRHG